MNIVSWTNYMSFKPQNGPTFHEHASQGFHVVLGEGQPSLVNLPTYVGGNCFPIWTTWPFSLGVNIIGTSHAYKYAMIGASS
jgi:hypothetical protein